MSVAQLIAVEYNGRHNAFEGQRNKHMVVDVANQDDIAPMIKAHLSGLTKGGYVLVKFANQLFMCEQDNVDATKPYRKHTIDYNPYAQEFTI